MIDSHCHLADPAFDSDRADVLLRARTAGVETVVCVADGVEASQRCLELAESHRAVTDAAPQLQLRRSSPHHAADFDDATASALERLLSDRGSSRSARRGWTTLRSLSSRDAARGLRLASGPAAALGKP